MTDHVVLASFTPHTFDFLPSMCEALAGEMCKTQPCPVEPTV